MRYAAATGEREIDRQPAFRGHEFELHGLDGFFTSTDERPESPLDCTGRDPAGHVVCLVSRDNGQTWHDHARSKETFGIYAIGGCRRVTEATGPAPPASIRRRATGPAPTPGPPA